MKDITKEKYLETILVIVVGLLVLYYFTDQHYIFIGALAVGLLSLLSKTVAKWITFGWYTLAHVLGYVNSRVLLTVLFFIFLVPIALLARTFQSKKDPLQLKKKGNGSYFITRNKKFTAGDLENLW